jgi:hypothetical protein
MTHRTTFTCRVSLWVPTRDEPDRLTWTPCTRLGPTFTDEMIQRCGELVSVLSAHARLVARMLESPSMTMPHHTEAFRLLGRHTDTGQLVAATEWARDRTGAYYPAAGGVWTSCNWGECPPVSLAA